MTTHAVFDGALAGALEALAEGRTYTANTNPAVAPALSIAAAANAFATQFLTANAALSTPMADATTNVALVCKAAAYAELSGQRQYVSAVATDYALLASNAAANAAAASVFLQ